MKKVFILLCISAALTACGGNSKPENAGSIDSVKATNETAVAANSSADTNATKTGTETTGSPAETLIAGSDCNSCHKVDTKIIGPSFQDVAAKYPATKANIELLAGKIINGGSGVWGDVPMTPHPALSSDDAKTIVKYILSLKK